VWRLAVDCAPYRLRCPENLLHCPRKLLGKRFVSENPSDGDNLVEGNVTRVLDVFLLFSIAWRLYDKSSII